MRKGFVLGMAIAGLLFPTGAAHAGGGPFATEFTQLMNYATLIKQLQQQAQMYVTLFQQYQQMIAQGRNLAQHPFTNLQNDLTQLFAVQNNGFRLAFTMAALDQQFRQTYQPFVAGTQPFSQIYAQWNTGTLGMIQNALGAAGLQAQQITNEQAAMNAIRNLLQAPQGQNQAIQIGNQIALEQVNQFEKLRALMAANMQSDAAIATMQLQTKAADEGAGNQAYTYVQRGADQRSW